MKIIRSFTGGNIEVVSLSEHEVILRDELRDTEGDWFYWAFAVEDAPEGKVTFRFDQPFRVGYYGAAVSHDLMHWQWSESAGEGESFTYTFGKNEGRVYFAHHMLYHPGRFESLVGRLGLEQKTLCISEKGRKIPYVSFGEGERVILLTARHHCCESTGNYVMEGVLEEMTAVPIEGYRVICVPFMDYDGVVDGDQGKNRRPYDHNRDYIPEKEAMYASVRAVREIADHQDVVYAFDFHSPWHIGGNNDLVYIPQKTIRRRKAINRFAGLFEAQMTPDCMGYKAQNDMPVNEDWNTYGTPCFGTYLSEVKGVELGFALETTYFGLNESKFEDKKAVATGHAFVRALKDYMAALTDEAKISFTGDLLCHETLLKQCKKENDYDFASQFIGMAGVLAASDCAVGNMETPVAGEEAKYTDERYRFNSPEAFLKAAARAGMDVFCLANNHCMDRGEEGIRNTVEAMKKNGVDFLGLLPDENGGRTFYKTLKGMKIALLNYTYGTNAFYHHLFLGENSKNKVNLLQPEETLEGSIHLLESSEKIAEETAELYNPENPLYRTVLKHYLERIEADIREAREKADIVIFCLHSGGQYNPEPEAYTKMLCEHIRKAGADLIVGLHPHRLQKSEKVDGIPTIYCLGNAMGGEIQPEYAYNAILHVYCRGGKLDRLTFSLMCLTEKDNEDSFEGWQKGKYAKEVLLREASLFGGQTYKEVKKEYPLF